MSQYSAINPSIPNNNSSQTTMCIDYFLADILNPANSSPIEAQAKMLNRHGLQLLGNMRDNLPLSDAIDCERSALGISFKDFLEELEQITDDLKLRISDDISEDGIMKLTLKAFVKSHITEIEYLLATKSSRNYSLILFLLASLCSKRIKLYCVTDSKLSSQSFGPKSQVTIRLLRMNHTFLNLRKTPGNSDGREFANQLLAVSRFRESRLTASDLEPINSTTEEITFRINNSSLWPHKTSPNKIPLGSSNSQDHHNNSDKSISQQKIYPESIERPCFTPSDLNVPCTDNRAEGLCRLYQQKETKNRFQSANQSRDFGTKPL